MAHLLARVAGEPSKPVTYLYSELGLSKAKGTKIKGFLVCAGLVEEIQGARTTVYLRPTPKARAWLLERQQLLTRPLARWETRRFGGEKSRELERVFRAYADRVLKPCSIVAEADDLAGGKHDLLLTLQDDSELAVELITGESKAIELRHVLAARKVGRRYLGVCWDEQILERVRRYLREAGIENGEGVCLITREEL